MNEPLPRLRGIDAFPVEEQEAIYLALRDNERFRQAHAAVLKAFRTAKERPAYLAGASYADKSTVLTRNLDGYFSLKKGPGDAGKAHSAKPLTGLVSPHIDFNRGKATYAWAYRELLRSGLADLTVILGVAHQGPRTPFIVTSKDYGTPFGPARTDEALAQKLCADLPFDARADELVHRTEHSIEFQAVYLRYCQQRLDIKDGPAILPILCSSCDIFGNNPGDRTRAFLDRLSDLLANYSGSICLLAGVDFAHIGPCFGDKEPAVGKFLEKTIREDKESLRKLEAQDSTGFLESVQFDDNARKVCGVSALYAFSELHKRLFPKSKGKTLHYDHAADPAGGEVGFAAQAFR
ncbi:MAG: AmmeMemoRadiSam system protein B [Elusimicrobia bacterium]|nr:MAG: AmmeMemoRadiSam system protein B [Elusimicrobiota bacterium]